MSVLAVDRAVWSGEAYPWVFAQISMGISRWNTDCCEEPVLANTTVVWLMSDGLLSQSQWSVGLSMQEHENAMT